MNQLFRWSIRKSLAKNVRRDEKMDFERHSVLDHLPKEMVLWKVKISIDKEKDIQLCQAHLVISIFKLQKILLYQHQLQLSKNIQLPTANHCFVIATKKIRLKLIIKCHQNRIVFPLTGHRRSPNQDISIISFKRCFHFPITRQRLIRKEIPQNLVHILRTLAFYQVVE